ncbi:hypothetical protein [Gorillibacterium sp. sgz5001074]|uniref:hypothetical protein n=1 Tax=Gorillibacterium sp. sgz5001074 TaxID=3446695 RepID=UPI003F67A67B
MEEKKWQKYVNSSATVDELTMIRDYVLLTHMQTMILHAIEEIEYSRDLLKQLQVETSQALLKKIDTDYYTIRVELKRRGIKLHESEESQSESGVMYYPFVCRGYSDRFGIMREVAKAEISVRLARYMRDLLTPCFGSPQH